MNETRPISHRNGRRRPIRRRIALLLLLPLVSLVGSWAFTASPPLSAALDKIKFTRTVNDIALPMGNIGVVLQVERTAAATVLHTQGRTGAQALSTAEAQTDALITVFRQKSLPASKDSLGASDRKVLNDLDQAYAGLGALRSRVHSGGIAPLDAIAQYNALFDDTNKALGLFATTNDLGVYETTIALVNMNWARDFTLREDALLSGLQSNGARLSAPEFSAFVKASAGRRQSMTLVLSSPSDEMAKALQPLVSSAQYRDFETLENTLTESDRAATPSILKQWKATIPHLSATWWQTELSATKGLTDQTESVGHRTVLRLELIGGLGILIIAASLALSLRFARGMSRELGGLQEAAERLADEQLPDVIARLRKGEKVDPPAEVTRLTVGSTREVAAVADAFTRVQHTAVDSAVSEARLRTGISRVFINLAWRSQSLLHRQLEMLDSMERRTSDPEELQDLFRLDHLTTRMRRHAEGLVILSGSETIRGWNEPIPVDDLLRAALSEVEDYPRVEVVTDAHAAVVGSVVADVIHMLAELIENATAYSPPNTEVTVRATLVGTGLAVEVVDRGVGLHTEELRAVNRRLADPPEFDLADSDRLGLFVVARIAARHDIKVALQPSLYGGISAVALLPMPLLVTDERALQERRGAQLVAPYRSIGAPPPAWPPQDRPEQPPAGGPDTGGLPRRTPQHNLAPQLRGAVPPGREAPAAGGGRPEASRDMFSALEAGWTAGRAADDGDDWPDRRPWTSTTEERP